MHGRTGRTLIAIATTLTALALPTAASAASRYVTEGGTTDPAAACTESEPCALEHAVEEVAQNGERVYVAPGLYNKTDGDDLEVGQSPDESIGLFAWNPHGSTRIQVQNSSSVVVAGGSGIIDIDIIGTAASVPALDVVGDASSARRVVVNVAGDAARVKSGGEIRDSLLFGSGRGLLAEGPGSATVRNVTAVSTNPNPISTGLIANFGITLDARNSIFRGQPAGNDVRADGAAVSLERSNFGASRVVQENGGTVTYGADSQTTSELTDNSAVFRDFLNQDYRLRDGSPAINAGGPSDSMVDFEGDPRSVDGTPDIGADEHFPSDAEAPGQVDFGSSPNGAPKQANLTVTNNGPGALRVSGSNIGGDHTGDFSADASACGYVDANASCEVPVTFTPGGAGQRTATLTLTTNDGNISVALRGTGTPVDRHVAPNPANPTNSTCAQANPCALEHAIENVARDGDTVRVAAGDYVQAGSNLEQGQSGAVTVEALDSAARPVVELQSSVWNVTTGRLSGVRITGTPTAGSGALGVGGVVRRVVVDVNGLAATGTGTISDSVLRGTEGGYVGSVPFFLAFGSGSRLVNVTAVGTGATANGITSRGGYFCIFFICPGGIDGSVNLRNVIARGGSSGFDLYSDPDTTDPDGDGRGEFTSSHSNYADTATEGGGAAQIATSEDDQTTAELTDDAAIFRDFAAGDYRQKPGSPTVDAGAADPSDGEADFEGQDRVRGASIDIGADEFQSALAELDAEIDVGQAAIGQPVSREVDVDNPSEAALTVAGATITGPNASDFAADVSDCASVPAGGACSIEVTMIPSANGGRTATLELASNSIPEPTVALRGRGSTPPTDPGPTDPGPTDPGTQPPPDDGTLPAADTDPPETTIERRKPKKGKKPKTPTYELSADEPDATFECAVDGGKFKACPATYKPKARGGGKHTLEVRAVDAAGNRDETPAEASWTVKKRKKAKK